MCCVLQGSSSSTLSTLNKRRKTLSVYSEELDRIARRDPLHPITVKEKDLLMRLKEDCKTLHQTIIPRIIDCVNYKDYQEVKELHSLLRSWPVIELQYALQLLDHKYPDERVHEYAVKCLREDDIQFVSAKPQTFYPLSELQAK